MFYAYLFLIWTLPIAVLVNLIWWLSSFVGKRHRRWGLRRTLLVMIVFFGMVVLYPVLTQCHYMFLDEPLIDSAHDGDSADVSRLLNLGANINGIGDDGRGTALIAAASENHPDVVRLLIHRGANVNEADDQTPLQAVAGHPEIIAMLKKAGAAE